MGLRQLAHPCAGCSASRLREKLGWRVRRSGKLRIDRGKE